MKFKLSDIQGVVPKKKQSNARMIAERYKIQERYRRSKKGLISRIYNHQIQCAKGRGHRPPIYSLEELREWMNNQEKFHILYDAWVNSGFISQHKPTIDRKNPNKSYEFNNIQIMTVNENIRKGALESWVGEKFKYKLRRSDIRELVECLNCGNKWVTLSNEPRCAKCRIRIKYFIPSNLPKILKVVRNG